MELGIMMPNLGRTEEKHTYFSNLTWLSNTTIIGREGGNRIDFCVVCSAMSTLSKEEDPKDFENSFHPRHVRTEDHDKGRCLAAALRFEV